MFRAINTAVNAAGTFVHGRKPEGSFDSIAAVYPLVFVLPFRDVADYKKETIKRSIVMFFFKQDNPGNTLVQREDMIQECYVIKDAFIQKMIEYSDTPGNTYFGKLTISEVLATPEYAQLAGTVSGYSVSFTLITKTDC